MKDLSLGLLFAMLWASASVATKIGLLSTEPFVLTNTRFCIAAAIMLVWAHLVRRHPLPERGYWGPLAVYGLLNCSVYLGAFSFSMRYCTAGVGTLAVAVNPLIISVLSAVFYKKRIPAQVWAGLLLGLAGVGVATWPALRNSSATPLGIFFLSLSMLSYSVGTVYYSNKTWTLPRLVINGWQIFFGALLLSPFTLLFSHWENNRFDGSYWLSIGWLVVPVSIGAVQLWLYLLKIDSVKAAMWLFLCPILGFVYARLLLNEPLTAYAGVGTLLVIGGLYLGRRKEI